VTDALDLALLRALREAPAASDPPPDEVLGRLAVRLAVRLAACLAPGRGGEDSAGLHRALLRRFGQPWDSGLLLLDERLRWPLLARPSTRARIAAFAERLAGPGGPLGERLALLGLVGRIHRAPAGPDLLLEAAARARTAGLAALDLSGRCQQAWEVQRSGLLGRPLLLGDLFSPLLVLGALADAGLAVDGDIAAVLAPRAAGDTRYYAEFPEMPRDADDAALLLAVARRWPQQFPGPLLVAAQEVVARALQPDGSVRVWVDETPQSWFGPRCPGVSARVLGALAGWPALVTPARLEAAWTHLEAQADAAGGFSGVHYPSRTVCTSLVVQAQIRAGIAPPAKDALAAAQGADGGWEGSPVATALALSTLAAAGALPAWTAAEGLAWLVHAQSWDGTWPAAGLFLVPSPDGSMRPFGRRLLSTALALAALTATQKVLA
jgi:hypothetical protein